MLPQRAQGFCFWCSIPISHQRLPLLFTGQCPDPPSTVVSILSILSPSFVSPQQASFPQPSLGATSEVADLSLPVSLYAVALPSPLELTWFMPR